MQQRPRATHNYCRVNAQSVTHQPASAAAWSSGQLTARPDFSNETKPRRAQRHGLSSEAAFNSPWLIVASEAVAAGTLGLAPGRICGTVLLNTDIIEGVLPSRPRLYAIFHSATHIKLLAGGGAKKRTRGSGPAAWPEISGVPRSRRRRWLVRPFGWAITPAAPQGEEGASGFLLRGERRCQAVSSAMPLACL